MSPKRQTNKSNVGIARMNQVVHSHGNIGNIADTHHDSSPRQMTTYELREYLKTMPDGIMLNIQIGGTADGNK